MVVGEIKRPARQPTMEEIPQVIIKIRLVRIPISRAAILFCWVAFMATPSLEYFRNRKRTIMTTRATTKVSTSRALTKTPPISTLS